MTAAVALIAGAGVAVSARVLSPGAAGGGAPLAGEPRFYVQLVARPQAGPFETVVRATATGAVTARVLAAGRRPTAKPITVGYSSKPGDPRSRVRAYRRGRKPAAAVPGTRPRPERGSG